MPVAPPLDEDFLARNPQYSIAPRSQGGSWSVFVSSDMPDSQELHFYSVSAEGEVRKVSS